ncbi:hypothetical protein F7725_000474 [Dissostichus mawsoni]|uniref:Uncharacterized protein n=1 Tax=Dissostichus mawsoni TaxID=36200 RepID=A0A7J5ZGW1_DISMA|nr:hypothetical protein F7725_000474 [Dissostichus mawsoni]
MCLPLPPLLRLSSPRCPSPPAPLWMTGREEDHGGVQAAADGGAEATGRKQTDQGGRRAAEEKGDLNGRSPLFLLRHGDLDHEGRRPRHPRPGVLRALLRHRSHHWQAGPVETQTDGAQRQRDGVSGRRVSMTATGMSYGFMLVSLSFLKT